MDDGGRCGVSAIRSLVVPLTRSGRCVRRVPGNEHRPRGDGDHAIRTIERTLDLLEGWPDLNEFKHTSIPR